MDRVSDCSIHHFLARPGHHQALDTLFGGVPHTFIHGFLAGVRHSRALDTLFGGVPHTSIRRLWGPGGVPGGVRGGSEIGFFWEISGNSGFFSPFCPLRGGVRGVKNRVFPRFPGGGTPELRKTGKTRAVLSMKFRVWGGPPVFGNSGKSGFFREIREIPGNSGNSGFFWEIPGNSGNSGKFGEFWEIRGIPGFPGVRGGVRGVGNRVFRHFWGGTPELKKRHF